VVRQQRATHQRIPMPTLIVQYKTTAQPSIPPSRASLLSMMNRFCNPVSASTPIQSVSLYDQVGDIRSQTRGIERKASERLQLYPAALAKPIRVRVGRAPSQSSQSVRVLHVTA
jgi:hypothetical protein